MSIRWRLTLWFSLILALILILSGIVAHLILQRYLMEEVDDELRIQSARVHGTLDSSEIPDPVDYNVIHSKLPPIDEFASPGIYLQLLDRDGNVVVRSHNLGDQELPVSTSLIERGFSGEVAIETVSAGAGTDLRMMVSPLFVQDETLLLEVGRSLQHIETVMSRVRWALVIAVLVALILAVVSGGVLVRRALAPVRRLTATAKSIESSSDLNRRVGYQGPMDDIGELAATFDHMIEQLARVFESQKHFIADASHDLRSPLTVVQANLDLARRRIDEGSRQECYDAMDAAIGRMRRLIDDLLLLARVESGDTRPAEVVPLRQLVMEDVERLRQSAEERLIIADRVEDITIRGDAFRLRRMLANLTDNALRYTSEGGTITISLARDGDWANLAVADDGIGISADHVPHIFDRFYRADRDRSRAKGGTGLGLAIVKGVAQQHGGDVSVNSAPGKGSTFTVRLRV